MSEIIKDTTAEAWDVASKSPFERWWHSEGSLAFKPGDEDEGTLCERLCAIAWANGVDEEKNREKKF
jgi:hypothetical protein